MSNYYEMLDLAPNANIADIHRAVDNRYNEMRQLATHPDATVVEEANRNLRLLEQMRATLTDANRRAAYDAGIGVGEAGGLADPAAILRKTTTPPLSRKAQSPPASTLPSPDLWVCPKCSTRNPEWTQFCLSCQNEMVRMCPECGQMKSLVKTGVCGNCGFSFDAAMQRISLNQEMNKLHGQVSARQASVATLNEELKNTKNNMLATIVIAVLIGPFCLFMATESLFFILLALVTIGGGGFFVQYFRRSARTIKQSIANEQAAVAQTHQQIDQLNEEYGQLGMQKRL